jgi:hypothetical protein
MESKGGNIHKVTFTYLCICEETCRTFHLPRMGLEFPSPFGLTNPHKNEPRSQPQREERCYPSLYNSFKGEEYRCTLPNHHNINVNTNPRLNVYQCNFITRQIKKNKILQILYSLCHCPPSIITPMVMWIVLYFEGFKLDIHLFVSHDMSTSLELV